MFSVQPSSGGRGGAVLYLGAVRGDYVIMSLPPMGCRDEDLLRLVDLCPFLASEKSQYDDNAVLAILKQNPQAACLRHSYRCGIGSTKKVHPLALAVALGGSLEVVQLMVKACPEALNEKVGGGTSARNILHYSIAEGVHVEIIQYITSQNDSLASELDSFEAVPLHLAATYPTSSPSVLRHLLDMHPEGAQSLDYRYLTPLHRACKSRQSLQKVLPLIEAFPEALFMKDGGRNTPLIWAEKIDHSLTDALPEVILVLEMIEDILTLGGGDESNNIREEGTETNERSDDCRCECARRMLAHFRSIQWWGGIRLAFARNIKLPSLLDVPTGLLPELFALLGCGNNHGGVDLEETEVSSSLKLRMDSVFSVLIRCPDVVCGTMSRRR